MEARLVDVEDKLKEMTALVERLYKENEELKRQHATTPPVNND